MTVLLPGVLVDPQGQSVSVSFVSQPSGATPSVFSDRFGLVPVSLPVTVSARTRFYLPSPGAYTANGIAFAVEADEVATVAIPTPAQTGAGGTPGMATVAGGSVTAALVAAVVASPQVGVWVSPSVTVSAAGLILGPSSFPTGIANFTVSSSSKGSIGYSGRIAAPAFPVTTGGGADGIQVYGSSGAEVQGIDFVGIGFVGANTNAVVHFGGRQRSCSMQDCFIQNTNGSAGAYGLILDTALAGQNSEDQYFRRLHVVGAYGAINIDGGSVTQHANDTLWEQITTSGGTYGLVGQGGGNHRFENYYDRSNPSVATVYNSGSSLIFAGGEDQNTVGVCHLLDSGASNTLLTSRSVTAAGGNNNVATISAGRLTLKDRCAINISSPSTAATVTLSGTGILDISDPTNNVANLTVAGAAGTLILAPSYPSGSPTISGFTGTVQYSPLPAVVAEGHASAQTTTQTVTWTPPAANVCFRVSVFVQVTTAGTSTVPNLTFTRYGGVAFNQNLSVTKEDGATTAVVAGSITTSGSYTAVFAGKTDNSKGPITVTITPTGSTFTYSVAIEQVTAS